MGLAAMPVENVKKITVKIAHFLVKMCNFDVDFFGKQIQ